MASHGVPRTASKHERTEEAKQREAKQIAEYKSLITYIDSEVKAKNYSPKLLEKTGALLQRNPEYYTIWNIRRRIYANEIQHILSQEKNEQLNADAKNSQILDIINLDLQFLFPLLLKFPKCYWIWNHRIWLLEQSSNLLPTEKAHKIWQDELGLVSKMLSRDSRNFHGWGYRRFIIRNLELLSNEGNSLAREEYSYTTKMIGSNLSNFSAWHNRIGLILRILDEENANPLERRQMLDEELSLIHKALFDPYDQSLWFYHQALMSAVDPTRCERSLVPDLSMSEKKARIDAEKDFILEILEDADDCKWAYQALIDCALIEGKVSNGLTNALKADISMWLTKLQKLDPLRLGRWLDLEARLA